MTRGTGTPNSIDVHVGQRVRLRRTFLGMSQGKLAEAIGLTFQQVQKYERGTNRISASRLFDLSRVLDVPVGYFFEDMDEDVAGPGPGRTRPRCTGGPSLDADPLARGETHELVRAYYGIADPMIRKRLFEMAKALGAGSKSEP